MTLMNVSDLQINSAEMEVGGNRIQEEGVGEARIQGEGVGGMYA